MKALYNAHTPCKKEAYYQQQANETHRIVLDYNHLILSNIQAQRLNMLLNQVCSVSDEQAFTRLAEKDDQGQMIALDFRHKTSAYHLLLRIETLLTEGENVTPREVKSKTKKEKQASIFAMPSPSAC